MMVSAQIDTSKAMLSRALSALFHLMLNLLLNWLLELVRRRIASMPFNFVLGILWGVDSTKSFLEAVSTY